MGFKTDAPPFKAKVMGDTSIISPAYRSFFETMHRTVNGNLKVLGNTISSSTDGDINLAITSPSTLILNGLTFPTTVGTVDDVIVTDGSGNLSFNDPTSLGVINTAGDLRMTYRTGSIAGWVAMNDGTIGNTSSGASNRANADTEDLFELLWDNVSNTYAPVSSGRGVSAQADFDANKTITLPRALGRILAGAGAGSGLTSRATGEYLGAETVALDDDSMPDHTHTLTARDENLTPTTATWAGSNLDNKTTRSGNAGAASPAAHENMQPSSFVNFYLKL